MPSLADCLPKPIFPQVKQAGKDMLPMYCKSWYWMDLSTPNMESSSAAVTDGMAFSHLASGRNAGANGWN